MSFVGLRSAKRSKWPGRSNHARHEIVAVEHSRTSIIDDSYPETHASTHFRAGAAEACRASQSGRSEPHNRIGLPAVTTRQGLGQTSSVQRGFDSHNIHGVVCKLNPPPPRPCRGSAMPGPRKRNDVVDVNVACVQHIPCP